MKNVKNIIIAAGIALIAGTAAAPVYAAGETTAAAVQPYGFVDLEYILNKSKVAIQASDELSAKKKSIEAEFDKKAQGLQAERDALIKQRTSLQQADFEKKMKDLQDRFVATSKQYDARHRDFDVVMKTTIGKIKDAAGDIVTKVAAEKGYAAVFTRDVVFIGSKDLDITSEVVSRMDANVKKIDIDWSPLNSSAASAPAKKSGK